MMELTCPNCSAPVKLRPVLNMRCRACGHRWKRVLDGGIIFDLQHAEGEAVVGPLSRARIRELLYAGSLTGRERVRAPGSDGGWSPLTECEEFSEVLELLDIQTQRERRIQGWQSQSTVRPAEAPDPLPQPTVPVREAEKSTTRPIIVLLGVVVTVIGLLYGLMLQW